MSGAAVGGAFADARLLGTDPTAIQGLAPQPRGERSPFEAPQRVPALNIVSLTPLEQLHGTITPSDLHFERHHAGIPQIDPERHRLLLHGMVERPIVFTVEDLKRFPAVTRTCFIECSGNLNVKANENSTPQMLCGLTSQSEWTGVSLRTLLREVGVKPGATWCLAEGSDAAVMARSIPMEKLLDDAMVAYAQNGEALRPAQGYPLRLLLPGWEGNTNVKWLRRLELSDAPFMTREETSKYTDPLKGGVARQFSVVMDARSVITTPTYPKQLEPGWSEIRGIAWSGRGKIVAVEVSTDGGKTWDRASLQGPILPKAHTRFGLPWKWDGKPTELASRAIDDTGYVQPTKEQLIHARGPGNQLYHLNPVMHWIVESDGRVLYKAEPWA
ncbi:sulfite dehydrogenase [Congregibacter brevis]|uniref:Sulfite dehydrogenase n=1 Tax=Congregibacter brevis TaxID=3081201 RepID=A0ABZ0I9X9_9GAMM|nr:sulfite dehydrogenase [Congregibacter sp. IMCC45268]